MEEKKTEDSNEIEAKGTRAADEEAIRAAEEAAHSTLPASMRIGGQAINSVKKLYYKLVAGRLSQLQQQVIDQDRELSELTHDIGQLTAQVTQMNRLLKGIDKRLVQLEDIVQDDNDEAGQG